MIIVQVDFFEGLLKHYNILLYFFFVSDTRETGFVNAIIAAGITYQVTRACTTGEIIGCSCAKRKERKSKKKGNGLMFYVIRVNRYFI